MDIFEIEGPVQLTGSIDVAGSKNAALPIMAAALLTPGESIIPNAPDLADIRSMELLLESLGAGDKVHGHRPRDLEPGIAPVGGQRQPGLVPPGNQNEAH